MRQRCAECDCGDGPCNWIVSKLAHKVMTVEEYAAMPIIGWHEVCRDYDGYGGVGIRFQGKQ